MKIGGTGNVGFVLSSGVVDPGLLSSVGDGGTVKDIYTTGSIIFPPLVSAVVGCDLETTGLVFLLPESIVLPFSSGWEIQCFDSGELHRLKSVGEETLLEGEARITFGDS